MTRSVGLISLESKLATVRARMDNDLQAPGL